MSIFGHLNVVLEWYSPLWICTLISVYRQDPGSSLLASSSNEWLQSEENRSTSAALCQTAASCAVWCYPRFDCHDTDILKWQINNTRVYGSNMNITVLKRNAKGQILTQHNVLLHINQLLTESHPSYVATFLHLGWPYYRGTTVYK